jgi:formate hydrogenlyase subunit 6/NADH:ubiquinone oxidoreductase subunit I
MLKLISYLIRKGVATQRTPFPKPDPDVWGFPEVTMAPCDAACNGCVEECPTDAIKITIDDGKPLLSLDRGACIGCGRCIEICPTKTIVNSRTYEVATVTREDLILTNSGQRKVAESKRTPASQFAYL